MNEIGLLIKPKQTRHSARKFRGCKTKKDHLTPALVVNMTCTNKLKPKIIQESLCLRCFGRWFANQTAWMTSYVFESWMMASMYISNLKKQKILLIMGNYVTHSLKHVGRGESSGLSTLQLSNICIVFLPPNFTSVVQPLDQGIIASLKVWYKKKLLEWILSQFNLCTHQHLRVIVSNVRHAIMQCSQAWREMNPQIKGNNWKIPRFDMSIGVLILPYIMNMSIP